MDTAATVQLSRLARVAAGLRRALRRSLDVALPPLCPACRDLVTDQGVCPACWSKLAFIAAPYCPRLGIPFAYDPGPGILSMQAIADPPAYQRARAAVRYDDVARKLVHAFKYGDRLDLAPLLGRWMTRAGRELFEGADALVPVPLDWRRLWTRRFNQSAALAEAISRESDIAVTHAPLRRATATADPQGRGVQGNQRHRQSRAAAGNDRTGEWRQHLPADFHRRDPRGRLRRTLRARTGRQARWAAC